MTGFLSSNLKEFHIENVARNKKEIKESLTALSCGLATLTVGAVIKNTFSFIENLPSQIVTYSATGAVMLGFAGLCYSASSQYYSQLKNLLETSDLKIQYDSILKNVKDMIKDSPNEIRFENINYQEQIRDKARGLYC